MSLDPKIEAVANIEKFIKDNPGRPMPVGFGCIDPRSALDILREGPLEVIDILKKRPLEADHIPHESRPVWRKK